MGYEGPPVGCSELQWLEHRLRVLHARQHGEPDPVLELPAAEPEPGEIGVHEWMRRLPKESEHMSKMRVAVETFFTDARVRAARTAALLVKRLHLPEDKPADDFRALPADTGDCD